MNIPAEYMLILSAVLFFIGVFGFFTRRNLVSLLISTELMLNAVDINFTGNGVGMKELGTALMGTDKYSFILPFEVMSVLLLACTVGAILIARKK